MGSPNTYLNKDKTIRPGAVYAQSEANEDILYRDPFITQFPSQKRALNFVLITSHVDPDDVDQELEISPRIVASARNHDLGKLEC